MLSSSNKQLESELVQVQRENEELVKQKLELGTVIEQNRPEWQKTLQWKSDLEKVERQLITDRATLEEAINDLNRERQLAQFAAQATS